MSTPHESDPTLDPQKGDPQEGTVREHAPSPSEHPPVTPRRIGAYLLIRSLGEGGMGQVWLAQQTAPMKREVALKLIRSGMFSSALLKRFEAERQSLAIMNHPAIAKVFDAGYTLDGQPYFVMEYVPGVPITRYCNEHKLSVRKRLELFVHVCEAVQHAHQKAIIHRDLKPSNILVVEGDGQPSPRVIDFGIAKVSTDVEPASERTFITRLGALVGTPGYMSPEQADPNVRDVDTRTDVYSLGVVLYELLTDTLPFEPAVWQKPFREALNHLQEEDPPNPSSRLTKDPSTMTATAAARNVQPTHLVSLLRGDLDWITMKALARERDRRYGSVSEFAADVTHFLRNEPVVARPPSAAYKLKKYVQRHKVGAAFATTALALLIGFGIFEYFQVQRIIRERNRADRITQFLIDMFKVADPSESRGNSVTAREILDRSFKKIDTDLPRDPEMQSKLMGAMGHVYLNLGLFKEAQSALEKSISAGRRAGATPDPSTLLNMSRLSFLLMREGRYAEAEALLRETIAGQRKTLGPNHLATLASMRYLASAEESEGKFAEADKLMRETLAEDENNFGPKHWETLLAMNVMANILDDEKRYSEAEQLYRGTMTLQIETLGPDHPDTLTSASNLGAELKNEGKLEEAEKLLRDTLAARARVLGPEHPDTLAVKLNLGNALDAQGRYGEAESLYRDTLAIQQRILGPDNPDALTTMENLGNTLRNENRIGDAENIQREAFERRKRVLGSAHPDTLKSMADLASTLSAEKHFSEAHELYKARLEAVSVSNDRDTLAAAWYDYACGAALLGKSDEAFSSLRKAIEFGFADAAHMKSDDDLKSLHGDSRFDALLALAQRHATPSDTAR